MRDDPQVLTRRLAAYVAPIPAKELARKIGCTERTAENIRRGHWPIARHWLGLIRAFGRDLTDCVFHPDEALARLTEEEAALEAKLRETRARIGAVADGGRRAPQGRAGVRAQAEARTFEPAD